MNTTNEPQVSGNCANQLSGTNANQIACDNATQKAGHSSKQTATSQATQISGHSSTQTAGNNSTCISGFLTKVVAGGLHIVAKRVDIPQVLVLNNQTIQWNPRNVAGYIELIDEKWYLNGDTKLGEHIIVDGILSKIIK